MRYLVAPNAFKHALDAPTAALAIARGLRKGDPSCEAVCCPVGDGGDGTGTLVIAALSGTLVPCAAVDPLGRPLTAAYGLVEGGRTAVIEMAAASGIRLLQADARDPKRADSFGTGLLVRDALDRGADHIVMAVGGSATVDGGMGILRALGVRFLDEAGGELGRPSDLRRLASIDMSPLHPRARKVRFTVLCDVENPLLGEEGAAAVFGPQKGAAPEDVGLLEGCLAVLAGRMQELTGRDTRNMRSAGAAGGVPAGLHALLGAEPVPGIDRFLEMVGFDRLVEGADVVVTGEGALDAQTLSGKAPYGVSLRARGKGKRVIALAGRIEDPERRLAPHFDELHCINPPGMALEDMLRQTASHLEGVAIGVAARLHLQGGAGLGT